MTDTPASGTRPARGYSWPPFEKGNLAAVRHGAKSRQLVEARAREIMTSALEDPAMPDHLRSPVFRAAVWAWAKAESAEERWFAWVEELGEAALLPPMPGTKPPYELWRASASHAANMRARLGLDPKSYAQISRDLGLADRALEAGLERMARHGAEISSRRAELEVAASDGS